MKQQTLENLELLSDNILSLYARELDTKEKSDYPYIDQYFRSAAPPEHSVYLFCHRCNVSWTGCDDEKECLFCGRDCLNHMDHPDNPEGKTARGTELESSITESLLRTKHK